MPPDLFPGVLGALIRADDLPAPVAEQVMDTIARDEATPAQIAAFAVPVRRAG